MSTELRRSSRLPAKNNNDNNSWSARCLKKSPALVMPTADRSPFLDLPSDIRLLIYPYLVVHDRPYMIGRCQEDKDADEHILNSNGIRVGIVPRSPRDLQARGTKIRFPVHRDDAPHRPGQPSITRVCRTVRFEALPMFYAENTFWLVHNRFLPGTGLSFKASKPTFKLDKKGYLQPRGFTSWLEQTPRDMFDYMRHVTLCGYGTMWPNRYQVKLDLKARTVVDVDYYSTYGDSLPLDRSFVDVQKILRDSVIEGGLAALQAVLQQCDWLFQVPPSSWGIGPRPFVVGRPLAEGWEYDW